MSAPRVLFVCVHNAGRSQMAAGLLQRKAGDRVSVLSAGSEPADQLNPAVVEAMNEVGILHRELHGHLCTVGMSHDDGTRDFLVTNPFSEGLRHICDTINRNGGRLSLKIRNPNVRIPAQLPGETTQIAPGETQAGK